MKHSSDRKYRKLIRLKDYDYSQPGAYFVTICTKDRECLFGEIVEGDLRLNQFGQLVSGIWNKITNHFPGVELDAFIAMPNHVHGILIITNYVGARHASPLQIPKTSRGPKPKSLSVIVGSYKSAVTKRINEIRGTPGKSVWQRNYYEHIIRTEEELNEIREYITDNPLKWELDEENPDVYPLAF